MKIGKRKLAALCAGKVVELEKGDYRQNQFFDLDIGGEEPLRIWVVKVTGATALVRLNQETPLEYLAADSSRGYTEWHPAALGRDATRTSTNTGHWCEPEPPVVYRDVLEAQTKEAKELNNLRRNFEHDRRLTEKQSLERRLTELVAIAKERGVDVHADIQFIRRRLDRIESKVKAP